jgi:hypothetical protein
MIIVARIKQKQNKPREYFLITSNLLQVYVTKESFLINSDPQRLVYTSQLISYQKLEEIFNLSKWNIKLHISHPYSIFESI